ncbi:hypothetical protein [Streptomyces vilmorinianum]|uniref:hypothetical protein n=1 Tax=Streptomyces vilmorinianum TaxID=3051092 RepID=UPI0010FAFD58|nr:hypothetical protein [Streptomyces vilmorinianum]
MDPSDASVITVVVAAAALVCRAAVLEMREPGTGRRAWAFATDRRALGTGLATAVALGAVGWVTVGAGAAVWAGLAGVLVASLTAQRRTPGE